MRKSVYQKKSCPHCGHPKVMEVICHKIIKDYQFQLPDFVKKGRVPVFELFVDSDGCILPNDCIDYINEENIDRFEKQVFFDGKRLSRRATDQLSECREIIDIFWKCKKCLRTWSPAGSEEFSKCPRCKMYSGVTIMYGMPDYQARRSMGRGELAGGGCCLSPNGPFSSCIVCGHTWEHPIDDLCLILEKRNFNH